MHREYLKKIHSEINQSNPHEEHAELIIQQIYKLQFPQLISNSKKFIQQYLIHRHK